MSGTPLYRKGLSHYYEGEFKKAYILFDEVFRQAPENPEVNFFLGRSAFELGDYETAVFAFERILIAEPENQRARLEMARSYWRMGSLEAAARLFNEVLENNPPDAVKANIEPYLAAIEKSRRRHFISLSMTSGINLDDNLNVSPVDDILTIPALDDLPVVVDGAESGHYIPLSLVFRHRYNFERFEGYWKNTVQTYHTRYPGHDELEVDYFSFSTGSGKAFGRWEIGLFPEGYLIQLDSQRYSRAIGATLQLDFFPSRKQKVSLAGFFRDKDFYKDDGRDGFETGADVVYAFQTGNLVVSPKMYFKEESADDDRYGYDRGGAGISVALPLAYHFNIFASYNFEFDEYHDKDALFETTRRDKTHALTAGISKTFQLTDQFRFQTGVSHTWETVDSSISLYEYNRNVTRLYISLIY